MKEPKVTRVDSRSNRKRELILCSSETEKSFASTRQKKLTSKALLFNIRLIGSLVSSQQFSEEIQ